MKLWDSVKALFGPAEEHGYQTEASLDLDILGAHEEASRHLVAVDLDRLARRNKERKASIHFAVGDLHVHAGSLRWTPHRMERTCGVPVIAFDRSRLRTIERRTGAIIAVLKDGTNVPFVVNTESVRGGEGRRLPLFRTKPNT